MIVFVFVNVVGFWVVDMLRGVVGVNNLVGVCFVKGSYIIVFCWFDYDWCFIF